MDCELKSTHFCRDPPKNTIQATPPLPSDRILDWWEEEINRLVREKSHKEKREKELGKRWMLGMYFRHVSWKEMPQGFTRFSMPKRNYSAIQSSIFSDVSKWTGVSQSQIELSTMTKWHTLRTLQEQPWGWSRNWTIRELSSTPFKR